jgi:hypothetical protein
MSLGSAASRSTPGSHSAVPPILIASRRFRCAVKGFPGRTPAHGDFQDRHLYCVLWVGHQASNGRYGHQGLDARLRVGAQNVVQRRRLIVVLKGGDQ